MNHTTTIKNLAITVGVLAVITAALTGTIAISIQQTAAAAYLKDSNSNNNSTDIEKSITDFKQKEKNNVVVLQPAAT